MDLAGVGGAVEVVKLGEIRGVKRVVDLAEVG